MTVSRYTLKDGNTRWLARVNVKDKQAKREGFKTREAAEEWQGETRKKLLAASRSGTLHLDVTIGELAEKWVEFKTPRIKPSTLVDYKKQLNKRILPAIGNRKIRDVTPLEMQALLDSLPSARLTNKTRVVLSSMFKTAHGWGLVSSDPTRPLRGVRETKQERRFLTHGEAARLLSHLEGQYHLLVFLALATGMRVGEISALRYGDVHKGYISVKRTYARGQFGEPKTKGSSRKVIICPEIYQAVKIHQQAQDNQSPDELIFTRGGKPLENWNIRDKLATASGRASLEPVRPHDLRHTYASWCLAGGISPKLVQQQLGHSTIAITMDLYQHIMEPMKDQYQTWLQHEIGRFSDGVIQDGEDRKAHDVTNNVVKLAGRNPSK